MLVTLLAFFSALPWRVVVPRFPRVEDAARFLAMIVPYPTKRPRIIAAVAFAAAVSTVQITRVHPEM